MPLASTQLLGATPQQEVAAAPALLPFLLDSIAVLAPLATLERTLNLRDTKAVGAWDVNGLVGLDGW